MNKVSKAAHEASRRVKATMHGSGPIALGRVHTPIALGRSNSPSALTRPSFINDALRPVPITVVHHSSPTTLLADKSKVPVLWKKPAWNAGGGGGDAGGASTSAPTQYNDGPSASAAPQDPPYVDDTPYQDPGGSYPSDSDDSQPPVTQALKHTQTAMTALSKPSMVALATAPTTKTLWQKIVDFLTFWKTKPAVTATLHGEGDSRVEMAQSVVRRARNGDQNAMALIALVRDNAAKGVAQAIISYKLMEDYIKKNPVGSPSFAADPQCKADENTIAVQLSFGVRLSNASIEAIMNKACQTPDEAQAFVAGFHGSSPSSFSPAIQRANRVGRIVAKAKKLQALRMPTVRASDVDSNIGWELGG